MACTCSPPFSMLRSYRRSARLVGILCMYVSLASTHKTHSLCMKFLTRWQLLFAICNSKSLIQCDFFHLSFTYLSLLSRLLRPTFHVTLLHSTFLLPLWVTLYKFISVRIIYGFRSECMYIYVCVCKCMVLSSISSHQHMQMRRMWTISVK